MYIARTPQAAHAHSLEFVSSGNKQIWEVVEQGATQRENAEEERTQSEFLQGNFDGAHCANVATDHAHTQTHTHALSLTSARTHAHFSTQYSAEKIILDHFKTLQANIWGPPSLTAPLLTQTQHTQRGCFVSCSSLIKKATDNWQVSWYRHFTEFIYTCSSTQAKHFSQAQDSSWNIHLPSGSFIQPQVTEKNVCIFSSVHMTLAVKKNYSNLILWLVCTKKDLWQNMCCLVEQWKFHCAITREKHTNLQEQLYSFAIRALCSISLKNIFSTKLEQCIVMNRYLYHNQGDCFQNHTQSFFKTKKNQQHLKTKKKHECVVFPIFLVRSTLQGDFSVQSQRRGNYASSVARQCFFHQKVYIFSLSELSVWQLVEIVRSWRMLPWANQMTHVCEFGSQSLVKNSKNGTCVVSSSLVFQVALGQMPFSKSGCEKKSEKNQKFILYLLFKESKLLGLCFWIAPQKI